MELNEIEVFIDRNGEVRIEVRGVKGPACLAATRELEASLGGQIVKREMTSESLEAPPVGLENQQWQTGG